MNNYIVYKHTSPSGKVYIGITGTNPKLRWNYGNGYRRNAYFTSAIKKYTREKIIHEILYENLSKEEAEHKEIELIAFYKSDQREFGYNIDSGGNCIGKISDESKRKMSEIKKGEKHFNYGKHLSKETREKISKGNTGKTLSDETRRKLSEANRVGQLYRSKKVVCIETDCEYLSLRSASRETGIAHSSIKDCCKGRRKSAGGYHWRYSLDTTKIGN